MLLITSKNVNSFINLNNTGCVSLSIHLTEFSHLLVFNIELEINFPLLINHSNQMYKYILLKESKVWSIILNLRHQWTHLCIHIMHTRLWFKSKDKEPSTLLKILEPPLNSKWLENPMDALTLNLYSFWIKIYKFELVDSFICCKYILIFFLWILKLAKDFNIFILEFQIFDGVA